MSFQFVRLRKRWITLSKLVSELKYTEKRLLKFSNTVFRSHLYIAIQFLKKKHVFYNVANYITFDSMKMVDI